MPVSIDEYRKYILSRNFTQNPSEYTMTISGAETITCYPDSFLLPGRNFVNTPFSYQGPEITFPLRREYNELSVNFIVYQDWFERYYFEEWMSTIIPSRSDSIRPDYMKSGLYTNTRDIQIMFHDRPLLSDDGFKFNSAFYFIDCYPLLITPMNCSSDNAGYTIFTVNFAIREYVMLRSAENTPTNKL